MTWGGIRLFHLCFSVISQGLFLHLLELPSLLREYVNNHHAHEQMGGKHILDVLGTVHVAKISIERCIDETAECA